MTYIASFWSDIMHQIGWQEKSSSHNINAVDDDDYIEIEVSSSPPTMHFGFQMTAASIFTDKHLTNTFPAREIFYKIGKLLHPTTLQHIVQNLLQATTTTADLNSSEEEDFIIMDFAIGKLNHDDNEHSPAEKSWSDELRPMKKSVVINKRLQASMAYLRSLFRKSGCKDLSSAKAQEYSPETGKQDGNKGFHLKSMAVEHKKVNKKGIEAKVISSHRSLSFSSAETKWRPPIIQCLAPSSSFPVSFSSGDFDGHKFHKRTCSCFTSDIEAPIEAAIAHCKKSQERH